MMLPVERRGPLFLATTGTIMPETIIEQLATAIRNERKRQGLTQPQLALAAGISERALRQVEAGKSTARLDIIARLLDALDLGIAIRRNARFDEAFAGLTAATGVTGPPAPVGPTGATGPSIAAFDSYWRREKRASEDADD